MSYISSATSCSSGATPLSAGPSSSTSRSPSAEPSTSRQRRLTLQDIHIPAGFEIAKDLGEAGTLEYPSEENIQKAAEVLQSLRGRMPDGSDGQVAACDYCRRRKIRCDRNKPTCGSCIASGRKCTTEDMLRKRGPPSKKERAILEAAGIIFRGTRPHRRRRTATTSLGSGAAKKQQEQMLRKIKEVEGTRTRANSTNSGEAAAAAAGLVGAMATDDQGKTSWMEMLSIATRSANPFADSPASSPSEVESQDAMFRMDAGACDYRVAHGYPRTSADAPWDIWAPSFGKQVHAAPLELPNLSAYACNVDSKDGMVRSPLASFDAGALDWTASNVSPAQYSMMYPQGGVQQHFDENVSVHMDPQLMVPHHQLHHQHHPQAQAIQPFISSPTSIAAEAMAFQSAMGHFFPKTEVMASSVSSLSNMSSSSSNAEVSTPSELDQFISIDHHLHGHQQQQQHLQQQQQMQFALSF